MQAPKKPKDAFKAAETLQKAADAAKEKFMNIFQQMQASPAAMAQKTYKVKSESKPIVPTSALIRPENPFSKAKPIAINPLLDSPKNFVTVEEPATDFRPFDTLSSTSSPDKPTIFDKLDNKVVRTCKWKRWRRWKRWKPQMWPHSKPPQQRPTNVFEERKVVNW